MFQQDAVDCERYGGHEHPDIPYGKGNIQERRKNTFGNQQDNACGNKYDADSLVDGDLLTKENPGQNDNEHRKGDGYQRKIDGRCRMTRKIDQRVEYGNPQQGRNRQVGQVLFHDIPLGPERFPGKGQKNDYGHNPSPKGQADGGDAFIQAAGNDKIARPDCRCTDSEKVAGKGLSIWGAVFQLSKALL